MKESVRRSGVAHRNPHPPQNYFASRLDRHAFRGRRCARRVGVYSTQIVALRFVSGPSGGTVRNVPPNLHARATRDQARRRLLSLPRLRCRSERVGRCPRADLPESDTAEAADADSLSRQVDDPSRGLGAFRGPGGRAIGGAGAMTRALMMLSGESMACSSSTSLHCGPRNTRAGDWCTNPIAASRRRH